MSLLVRLAVTVLAVCLSTAAKAESARHGDGHSKYHHAYKGLMRPDAPTSSCCNDIDCRPTQAKFNAATGNKIVDGDVPAELASEAHLCAPPAAWPGYGKDDVFCFIRPNGGS